MTDDERCEKFEKLLATHVGGLALVADGLRAEGLSEDAMALDELIEQIQGFYIY